MFSSLLTFQDSNVSHVVLMSNILSTGLFSIIILLLYSLRPVDQRWSFRTHYKLPEGPPGLPVFGNLLQSMKARKSGQLSQWLGSMRQYGEMTTLHLGSQTWILLNSKEAADSIINKQGKFTNERPPMPVASDLVSHGKRTVIRPAAQWTEGRRVMHHLLSGSVLRTYGAWQELVSLQLLTSYLKKPEDWYAHHFEYSLAVLYSVVLGGELNKSKAELDEFQQVGIEFVRSISQSMIDFFPLLAKIPVFLQPWNPFWRAMGDRHRAVMFDWWSPVARQVRDGSAGPSFVRDTLLHPNIKYKGDEEEAMYLAISVITAGGDNTRMSLNTFIMSMISHPDAFAKARQEIDKLCDVSDDNFRLPGIQDLESLPYVAAIIKEVLRWRPTVPLVPPHQSTQELRYKDFVFPRGVCFVVNNIAISQEAEEWNVFDPFRWIDGTQTNVVSDHWAFGGGRRICVGYRVAQQALFIAIARLIFCFDICANGEYNTQVLNHTSLQEPFPVSVKIRGPRYIALIRQEPARHS